MSRFAWRDLMSVDPEISGAFFTALFGWTQVPIEIEPLGVYRQLFHGDHILGGILALDPAIKHPSHWLSYIDVASLDAAVAKTARLGGTVASAPAEIPGVGRFALLADPQDALFCALEWHAGAARPPEPEEAAEPGEIAWNELLTADPTAAARFYGKLFNWTARSSVDARGPYRTMVRGDRPTAGMRARLPGMAMSAWLIYFEVADLDVSLERVRELGGRVVSDVVEDERFGRFAYAADPTEAGFGLMQSVP
jgi:predicted enzyme related to lactoylglutathione lyase